LVAWMVPEGTLMRILSSRWSGRDTSNTNWGEQQPRLLLSGRGMTTRGLLAVAWSHDGQQLATGNADRTVQLWQLESGDSVTLKGHTKAVTAVSWEQLGGGDDTVPRVASASWDGTVRVWEQQGQGQGWKCRGLLRGSPNNDAVRAVAWRPSRGPGVAPGTTGYDLANLASAGVDGTKLGPRPRPPPPSGFPQALVPIPTSRPAV
jgi:WD40 repeat protein